MADRLWVSLPSLDAAKLWMIEHQLGQRNLNNDQRTYWIGKHYELEKKLHGGDRKSSDQNGHLKTRKQVAEQHKVGEATVQRDSQFARAVDTIADKIGDPAVTCSIQPLSGRSDVSNLCRTAPVGLR